jgi:hypothetical protein
MEAPDALRVVMLAVELTGFWAGVWLGVFLWQKLRLPLATAAAPLGALAATLVLGVLGRDVAALATGSLKFGAGAQNPEGTDFSIATSEAPLPPSAPSPRTADCPAGSAIVNGSFEKPVVPIGTFSSEQQFVHPAGEETITGWHVLGTRGKYFGQVALVSGSYAPDDGHGGHPSFAAKDGVQWLNLAGFEPGVPHGVEQSVCTTPGRRYRLTFWVGNVVEEGNAGIGQTSTVEVWIDGYSKFVAVNSGAPSDSRVAWKRFDTSFVAETTSTRIGLRSGDPYGDKVNGIDGVELAAD